MQSITDVLSKIAAAFPSLIEKKVPKMSENWGSFVLNELRSWGQLPPAASADFEYLDRDEAEKGYSTATVVLGVGDTLINIPVIIRDWKVCPMDVMEVGGEFFPLTGRRLGQLMAFAPPYSDQPVSKSQIRPDNENLTELLSPPYFRGGLVKDASLKEKLAGLPRHAWWVAIHSQQEKLAAERWPKLAEKLAGSPSRNSDYEQAFKSLDSRAFAQYRKHGTYDVLMALIKPETDARKAQVAQVYGDSMEVRHPDAGVKVIWVPRPSQEDANHGFGTALGASGRSFDPAIIHLPIKDMMALYSCENGLDPSVDAGVFVSTDAQDGVPISDTAWDGAEGHDIGVAELDLNNLAHDADLKVLSAEEGSDGHYNSASAENVISRFYSPMNLDKSTQAILTSGRKLLVGEKFYGAYTNMRSRKSHDSFDGDASSFSPTDSDQYIFLCRDGGVLSACGPFHIDSKTSAPINDGDEGPGEIKHMVNEYTGRFGTTPVRILRSGMFQDLASHKLAGRIEVMLPAGYRAVRISDVVNSPMTPADVDFMAKQAHEAAADWLTGFSIDGGAHIVLDMPEEVKLAYKKVLAENKTQLDLSHLEPKHAEFLLIAAGIERGDAARFVKTAAAQSITAYGVAYLPPAVKQADGSEELKQKLALRRKFAAAVCAILLKEAAEIGDHKTVDSVLGLGLASESNVDSLIDSIPRYEEILKHLAEMLKDARLSGGPVQESAIQKAMVAVENFLEQAEAYMAALSQLRTGRRGVAAPAA